MNVEHAVIVRHVPTRPADAWTFEPAASGGGDDLGAP